MKFIAEHINKAYKVPKESLVALFSLATYVELPKGYVIAGPNKKSEYFYILKSGVSRSFYSDIHGKQYIRSFFTTQAATGPLHALINKTESKLTYDCLTDCTAFKFNFLDFLELTKKDIHISILYSKLLEDFFGQLEKKIYDLTMLNATERYLTLLENKPKIEESVNQYHIAAYLNITPVQLSRIKRDLKKK